MSGEGGDSVVIRAEWFSDIPEQAAKDAAAVKALGDEIKSSTGGAAEVSAKLGKEIDGVNERTHSLATGGATKLNAAYKDLHESGSKLRESFASLGETIHYHLMYPMQQLGWVMEGAVAGMVGFGLVTQSSLQQANLQLTQFSGSASVAANAVNQLRSMQGAVGLSGLSAAYETLGQSGMGSSRILPLMRALTGISDVSLNPAGSMQQMSAAIASMTSTGLLTASDVNAFSGAGVDVWGMLAKETGQTPAELRMRFLRAGTPMAVPGSFMSDLMGSSQAKGGAAAYDKTWAGQFEQTKKAAGDLLGVLETPLGNALASAGSKIDRWATATESRFKQMGGQIGSEWSSGNMGGLSNTIAQIVGDPKLAGDINIMATSLHGFSQVVTRSVIPTAHEMLTIATPALHAFADVLGFLGQHKSITDEMLVTFGGFVVLSKVAQWAGTATSAMRAFNAILESKGALAAMAAYSRGLTGLSAAEEAAAAAGGGAGASGKVGGAMSVLGKLGVAAGGAGLAYQGMTSKFGVGSALETVGGDAAFGAMVGSVIPGVGTLAGGIGGGIVGGITDLFRLGQSQTAHHTSIGTVRQINITIPGAGNPNKVANSIPKAINAQIASSQQRATRRGAAS